MSPNDPQAYVASEEVFDKTDPTRLTRDAVNQALDISRRELESVKDLLCERMDGMEARVNQLNEAGHSLIEQRIAGVERVANEHVEQLRREREIVTGAQMEAIDKAEKATEKRFEAVNEFRRQLNDQTQQFMPREVAEAQFAELRKITNSNTERLNTMTGVNEGKAKAGIGFQTNIGLVIAIASVMVGIIAIIATVIIANMGSG